jgi:two-component system, OmpR family, response regulator
MRILLAEDDMHIRSIARVTLERLGGHQVTVVENGLEAVHISQSQEFDLLILDGMMPELDGFEACSRIKSEAGPCRETPVIFMTAKSQASDIQEGFNRGAIGYIVKPFDIKTLCTEINNLYDRHRATAEGRHVESA